MRLSILLYSKSDALLDSKSFVIELSLFEQSFATSILVLGSLAIKLKSFCEIRLISLFIETFFHEFSDFENCIWFGI